MVLMGFLAAMAVCFFIRPVSARKELKENMIHVTDSFGDMLAMITRSFLMGSAEELQQKAFVSVSDRYRSVMSSLAKNLKEAKYEHYIFGTETESHLETMLVNCMQRMAQDIGGLRSAASTQFDLLAQGPSIGSATPVKSMYTPVSAHTLHSVDSWSSLPDNYAVLTAIDEHPEEEDVGQETSKGARQDSIDGLPTIRSPTDIFERFISHLGPAMKSLAYTLKQILDDLPYGPAPEYAIPDHTRYQESLMEAIKLYSSAREQSLALLYKKKDLHAARPMEMAADFEEVAASCGHFSFSLQDFAEEMRVYLDILDQLKVETDHTSRKRSWNWLKFWHRSSRKKEPGHKTDPGKNDSFPPSFSVLTFYRTRGSDCWS
jgi:hypothetical protein